MLLDHRRHGGTRQLGEPPHTVQSMAEDTLRTLTVGQADGRCVVAGRQPSASRSSAYLNPRRGIPPHVRPSNTTYVLTPFPVPPYSCAACRWGEVTAILGHSIGGLVALEVAQRLAAADDPPRAGALGSSKGPTCQPAAVSLLDVTCSTCLPSSTAGLRREAADRRGSPTASPTSPCALSPLLCRSLHHRQPCDARGRRAPAARRGGGVLCCRVRHARARGVPAAGGGRAGRAYAGGGRSRHVCSKWGIQELRPACCPQQASHVPMRASVGSLHAPLLATAACGPTPCACSGA